MPSRPLFRPSSPRRRPARPAARRARPYLPLGPHVSLRADVTGSGGLVIGGGGGVTFEHRQVPANVRVYVDWDNDGDFDQPEEDITADVQHLECKTGRDWPSQLTGKAGPGDLRGTLTNTDDRYSFYNASSPLSTAPFSLELGKKVRVATTEAADPDPVLLARDRFLRADGALGSAETGQVWENINASYPYEIQGHKAAATNHDGLGPEHLALLNLGVNDYYLQITHGELQSGSYAVIYYRYQDANNYGLLLRDSLGGMSLFTLIGGVGLNIDLGVWSGIGNKTNGITFGVRVQGSTATAYVEGVNIGSAAAAPFSDTRAGIGLYWTVTDTARPSIHSFHAWDGLPVETEGVLWTGTLEDLVPKMTPTAGKVASIVATGPLGRLATTDITPEVSLDGNYTGIAVGHMLSKAQANHPPGIIQQGDILTGPYGFDRQKALTLARLFEETEFGFLYEAQEGWLNYEARTARDSSYPVATFSDRPGTQYSYETIDHRDWRREIINQVQAGVAPRVLDPSVMTNFSDSNTTNAGVANDVQVDLPASGLGTGDLVIIFITSTVGTSVNTVPWLNPIHWQSMRTGNAGPGRQQIYAHVCFGNEDGTSVLFYDDTSNAGGAWFAEGYVIPRSQWYGSLEGLAVAEHVPGDNPPPLPVPWGLLPTLFFTTHACMVSFLGGSLPSSNFRPHGYGFGSGTMMNHANNAFDLSSEVLWKTDITAVEDPTPFGSGFEAGFGTVESCTVAVRGYNGDPIPNTNVVKVDLEDTASQDAHGGVPKSHTGTDLFQHPAQAEVYCDRVLGRYANDRPIFQIGFTATKGAGYRRQAIQRRVSHRLRLQADGNSGFGVDADMHIESVTHRFDQGVTNWFCLWELSPAETVLRADTTASELTSSLAAAEPGEVSTWQVTITDGELWLLSADHPNMFPVLVRVDNETILVDEITGSSSPQTFTGRRGFNGWEQAHSAGTAISLADPWVLP